MSLDDRLRMRLQDAGASIPVVVLDLDETLARGRRARRVSLALAAGAAAIAIGLGTVGVAALTNGGDGPQPVPPAGERDESPRPSVTSPPTPRGDEVVSTLQPWLQAIQDGDEDSAWALMTEGARSEIGRAQFDQLMASALPEGLGAFADPSLDVDIIEIEMAEGEMGLVATLSGEVEREGMTEFATEAIPMRIEGGRPLVDEIFDDRYRDRVITVFTSESLGPMPLREGDELVVEVAQPEDVESVFLSIDDTSPALGARFNPASGRGIVTLDHTLDAGRHIATIIVVDVGGRMFPDARIFETASP